MKVTLKLVLALAMVLSAARHDFAGVTVTQNIGPGATSWPDTPLIKTVNNPSSQLTVGESFGGATSYTETFTVPAPNNYSLQTILRLCRLGHARRYWTRCLRSSL